MHHSKHVLIIEDDSIQARRLSELIRERFPAFEPELIATESEFLTKLEDFATSTHALAIVDMMLRWADPSAEMPMPPQEIIDEGFFRGGMRCRQALIEKGIPTIIYTVLDQANIAGLPAEDYVRKSTSPEALLRKISRLVAPVAP